VGKGRGTAHLTCGWKAGKRMKREGEALLIRAVCVAERDKKGKGREEEARKERYEERKEKRATGGEGSRGKKKRRESNLLLSQGFLDERRKKREKSCRN